MEEHREARFIVNTLSKAGFVAYYAGGWVRDYLLKHPSDDIDIATNAPPETIQALFPHTVPIGIAFGIILVIVDGRDYEVATFRQDFDYTDGRRPTKIEFSSAQEDAKRRDFTINGMFYDPLTEQILDYVGGKEDLQKKIIRAIGNPHERIREDRLRMIRAIRLSCRFRFTIEESTKNAILAHAKELFPAVAIERIVQEFTKAHQFGALSDMLFQLHEFGLLSSLLPKLTHEPLSNVEINLLPTKKYPKEAPVVAFILALFPKMTPKGKQDLCKSLKLPNVDLEFVTVLSTAEALIQKDPQQITKVDWAYLYANKWANLCLDILSAQGKISREEHAQRQNLLCKEIFRIQKKTPVVTAEMLLAKGVLPGPSLGRLLKEAEQISINEGIENPSLILQKLNLKNTSPS